VLSACGSGTEDVPDTGRFTVATTSEGCTARQSENGVTLFRSFEAPELLVFSMQAAGATEALFFVEDRVILTVPFAGGAQGVFQFSDPRVFWAAFGQADRIVAGDISLPIGDPDGLRTALARCMSTGPNG